MSGVVVLNKIKIKFPRAMPMPNTQALKKWLATSLSSGRRHIGIRDDLALVEWSSLLRQLFPGAGITQSPVVP